MAYEVFSLEHEILNLLFTIPKFEIISFGNEADGMNPIYKQSISSSVLHFGTLVDILNNPDKYKGSQPKISQQKAKQHEIKDEIHSFKSVSIAIEVLSANGHVKDDYGTEQRIIRLTEPGAIALFTKVYLKERQRETRDEQFHDSQVDTNFYMKWLTIILAVSAFITMIIQGWQCNISRKQLLLQQAESSRQLGLSQKNLPSDSATLDMGHPSDTNDKIHSLPTSLGDTTVSFADTSKTPTKPK